MRYITKINEDLTQKKYGYKGKDLLPGSHNKVIVECDNCHQIFNKEYRYIDKLHQCSVINGNKKRCFGCKTWKFIEEFPKWSSGSGGVGKLCKICHNSHPSVVNYEIDRLEKRKILFTTDIKMYLRKRCYSVKKQSGYKQVPFNLTPDYLIKLWNEQEGKCFYTKIPMVSHGREYGWQRWDSPSIDRKEPDDGYIKGNVVWCCFGINSFKGRLNEKQFINKLKQIKWWYEI